MKAQAKFLNPDAMEVEITFTATLHEWTFVDNAIKTSTVPATKFANHLRAIINKVKGEFTHEIIGENYD
jgi:hypothetical protein